MEFKLQSDYSPKGDQPEAISSIVKGINKGYAGQTLLGVTGSGKTFTIANIIEKTQKPTLILAHNKTLAAQLYGEFKEFFPNNAVEYFVSYYDYYRPEAYIPSTDTFIEKDSTVNEEIDKLRHSTTSSLLERRDVIVIASVSCIYGLGDPEDYSALILSLRPGMQIERDDVLRKLIEMQYERNDINFVRGKFRVRGDVVEILTSTDGENALRVEFFGDEIEKITEVNVITGEALGTRSYCAIFPNSHYVTTREKMERAIYDIQAELDEHHAKLIEEDKLVEAQRILQRTNYDIEMMREIGFCSGIENYSRHISGREAGTPPFTLIDFFPKDFLLVIDEAHVTVPQVRAMWSGDHARKTNLINYGFRLPSAFDNRPLCFEEFEGKINQAIYVSATPANYEKEHSEQIIEQIIRPTGLIDPQIFVRPIKGQIDDLYGEIQTTINNGGRTLITTLTKRMAEDLTDYLEGLEVKVQYMHSDVETLKRMEIIRDLRNGEFDVLVGINLLREGLDLPEVQLVAILDADKEGFLRSETSLIQTIGRAARNVDGRVLMYADRITGSMDRAISETNRRRKLQMEFNKTHGITPQSIKKVVHKVISTMTEIEEDQPERQMTDIVSEIEILRNEMQLAACDLQFEKAAQLRDKIKKLEKELQ